MACAEQWATDIGPVIEQFAAVNGNRLLCKECCRICPGPAEVLGVAFTSRVYTVSEIYHTMLVGWLTGSLSSQQNTGVSQGQICVDSLTCCHTETHVANQTCCLIQSQHSSVSLFLSVAHSVRLADCLSVSQYNVSVILSVAPSLIFLCQSVLTSQCPPHMFHVFNTFCRYSYILCKS